MPFKWAISLSAALMLALTSNGLATAQTSRENDAAAKKAAEVCQKILGSCIIYAAFALARIARNGVIMRVKCSTLRRVQTLSAANH